MPTQTELRTQITQRIADALEKDHIPWRRPWRTCRNCSGPHRNVVSRRAYSGINVPLLQLAALEAGWASPLWATYQQFGQRGCQVRKGSKGTQVVLYRTVERSDIAGSEDEEGGQKRGRFFLLRTFTVFNLEQVDGSALDRYRPQAAPQEPEVFADWSPCERAVAATKADIHSVESDRAFYVRPLGGRFPAHTGGDYIQMPLRRQFVDMRDYYATLLHELAHWSEARLGWSGSYAEGEIIAEQSACYLANELGVPQSEDLSNHARYVRSWLKAMQDDPRWVFRAATQASRVTDFILSFSRTAADAEGPLTSQDENNEVKTEDAHAAV